ncbi:MAG: macro domain-containing protein [Schwartzia sp.]|nr:macro domain-containing protein [Schwartzia sp. (in: firmicutes)]
MPLEIVRNDITKIQVDAIVNTANPRPVVGGGVDRAIHKAAGAELLVARKKIGDIATGKAFITPAYDLPADYVIHTVGPVWQDGRHGERELLTECYTNSLRLASENQCSSIAFPLISAGVFGCPAEIAIATATQAIRDFLVQHDIEVYLVVFDRKSFRISNSLFDDVQNYLDEMYVEEILDEEYRGDDRDRRRMGFQAPAYLGDEAPASKESISAPVGAAATSSFEKGSVTTNG